MYGNKTSVAGLDELCDAQAVFSILNWFGNIRGLVSSESFKASEPTSGRCCPCPDDLDTLAQSRQGGDLAGSASESARSVSGLDCPCQSRDADSLGSPSLFFPTVVRAMRPYPSSATEKNGDFKPLLHPEVDLASSVLETLREVTDEEYRDAVARDSARSVARSLESGNGEESSVVPIATIDIEEAIPADDMITEGTHNHETRCLDSPLGRSMSRSSVPFNPPDLLTDILKLPLRRSKSFKNLLDWDNGFQATNINEQRLKVGSANKENNLSSKLDPLNIFSRNTEHTKSHLDINHRRGKKIIKPTFKEPQEEGLPNILHLLPKPNIHRISLFGKTNACEENEKFMKNADGMSAASSVVNSFAEPNSADTPDKWSLVAEGSSNRRNNKKINNINHMIKPKITDFDQTKLKSKSKNRDAVSDLLNNVLEGLQHPTHLFDINNIFSTTEFPQFEDKEAENTSGTKILDTIQSPSIKKENGINNEGLECIISDSDNKERNGIKSFIDEMNINTEVHDNSVKPMKTKIITHVPNNDNNDEDSLESVNDSENETAEDNDDEHNVPNERNKQGLGDISMDMSNNFATTSLTDESDNIPQFDNIDSEESIEINAEQSKSAEDSHLSKEDNQHKYIPHTKKILQNLGKIRIPEIKKSTSFKTIKDNVNTVSLGDLQKMSDSLLDKEKSRSTELSDDMKSNKLSDDCLVESTLTRNNNNENEMASAASENLFNILGQSNGNQLKSALFPGIVEPMSFDIGQNYFSGSSTNLVKMLNNLPKLDIPNIFDSEQSLLSPDQRLLSNTKPFLSDLPPLEDINLDIIQFKPISTQGRSSISRIPSINLNSYKTRLPLPKSLDLKPVVLESAVKSKDGGVLDAILTLGKRNNGILDNSNILKSPIALPDIDDISETLLENAHNLLSTPLETTGRNLIEDTLRSSQVLSENFKVHTKNAVNDIQKNLESSLKNVGIASRGSLGNALASNQNVLQDISRKHEEFEDKLKGMHHDFADRLETLRYNINEHIPNLEAMTRNTEYNILPEPKIKKPKKNESTKILNRNVKEKYDPSRSSSYRSHLNMIPSSSIDRPTIVKKPLFDLPLLQLPKSKPLNLQPRSNEPVLNLFKKPRKTLLKQTDAKSNTKPFLTAKQKPIFDTKLKLQTKPFITKDVFPQSNNARKSFLEPKTRQFGRLQASPSEIRAKYADPIRSSIQPKSSKIPLSPRKPKLIPIVNIKPPILKTSLIGGKQLDLKELLRPKTKLLKNSLPVIDNTLLAKVKDTLAPIRPSKAGERSSDMLKSASRNVEVRDSHSMKENTPYTCKMVCSKNR